MKTRYKLDRCWRRLEVAENFMKAEVFRDAEASPLSEVEIHEEGEEDDPREVQKQRGER